MEVLVRITKKCLKTIAKDALLSKETLGTFLVEVVSIVNSQPLTSVIDDSNDLQSITPNHFLIGRSSWNATFAVISEKDVSSCTK